MEVQIVKSISVSKLSAGSGSAKVVEKGGSLIVTDDGKPVAIYRPHEASDKGKKVNAAKFYNKIPMCMQEVRQDKKVLVTRRGTLFATLCPYEEVKKPMKKARAKRRSRPRPKPTSPPPVASQEAATEASTVDEAVPDRHQASVELLNLAAKLPPGLDIELMTRGFLLHDSGQLEKGLHLLELLEEGKLAEALAGLKLLMD